VLRRNNRSFRLGRLDNSLPIIADVSHACRCESDNRLSHLRSKGGPIFAGHDLSRAGHARSWQSGPCGLDPPRRNLPRRIRPRFLCLTLGRPSGTMSVRASSSCGRRATFELSCAAASANAARRARSASASTIGGLSNSYGSKLIKTDLQPTWWHLALRAGFTATERQSSVMGAKYPPQALTGCRVLDATIGPSSTAAG
jgi:hypothetical protein